MICRSIDFVLSLLMIGLIAVAILYTPFFAVIDRLLVRHRLRKVKHDDTLWSDF